MWKAEDIYTMKVETRDNFYSAALVCLGAGGARSFRRSDKNRTNVSSSCRRMFPVLKLHVSQLEPTAMYAMVLEFRCTNQHRSVSHYIAHSLCNFMYVPTSLLCYVAKCRFAPGYSATWYVSLCTYVASFAA